MWKVLLTKKARKVIEKQPRQVKEKYQLWLNVVTRSGPEGLKAITGFNDEPLKGKHDGFRSSRLNLNVRVIYRVDRNIITIHVETITAQHDYRKR